MCLHYGNLITKILEHTRFNFGEEEFVKDVTKIGEVVLAIMRYEITYRKCFVLEPEMRSLNEGDGGSQPLMRWSGGTYKVNTQTLKSVYEGE